MSETNTPRRVKIGKEERTGWSSERPPRDGDEKRPALRVNARVLTPAVALTYSPRSLIVVCAADESARAHLLKRAFPAEALLSKPRVADMLVGRAPAEQIPLLAERLFADTVKKRLLAGRPVVVEAQTLDESERELLLALAESAKRSAHLIVLNIGRQALGDDEAFYKLQALVQAARSGEVGFEGFRTSLVLGRSDIEALRSVEFVLPRQRL
jgi:hypothetical protein